MEIGHVYSLLVWYMQLSLVYIVAYVLLFSLKKKKLLSSLFSFGELCGCCRSLWAKLLKYISHSPIQHVFTNFPSFTYIVAWSTCVIFVNAGPHVHGIWFTCSFPEGITLLLFFFFPFLHLLKTRFYVIYSFEGLGEERIQHRGVGSLYYKSRIIWD